jgi:hypothetical protein
MTITNSEGQWLTQVMDTIKHLSSCNAGDKRLPNSAGEDVLSAAHRLIQLTKLAGRGR